MKKNAGAVLWACILPILCIVTAVFTVAIHSTNLKTPLTVERSIPEEHTGWYIRNPGYSLPVEPGSTMSNASPELIITRDVFPEEIGKSILFFRNNRQSVTVTADGEELYRIGSGTGGLKLSATGCCAVTLPKKGCAYPLEIKFSNLEQGTCDIPRFYFCSLSDILITVCSEDVITLTSLPLWLLIGLGLIVLSILLIRKKIREYRIICLAAFLVVASFWSFTDMTFTSLLPMDLEVASTIAHYLLMLMPIPPLFFIKLSCKNREPRSFRLCLSVLLLNVVVQTVLFLARIISIHDLLLISQGLLLLMLFYCLAASVLDNRAAPSVVGRLQNVSFIIASSAGVVIVLCFWLRPDDWYLYRAMFQFAIFIFLLAMVSILLFSIDQQNQKVKIKDAELNAYRAISTIDQLTGLNNRRAFDLKMEEIQSDDKAIPNATLVFMDLNGLKYANDKYGHLAGDELIIAAGKCMQQGFDDVGSTYRIGGDEFAAIVIGDSATASDCYRKMDRAIDAYNQTATVPLSVARGEHSLLDSSGRRLTISDWKMLADKRMYEDKVINRRSAARGTADDYLEIISSFVSAVDAKDSYTADHSERVGLLTDCICRLLGLSEASIDQIHVAACLHDIGKIGIPDSILCKSDKLTDDEWRIMQSHTLVGEEIVKHTRAFYDVSQIIRHHHERYDGSGYPDGLAGSEIPLGARIVSIADSIDAMTSSRSYRGSLSLGECKKEIRRCLGTMYDPAIGSIVLEHWSEIESIVLSQPK